jgi:hypothetical protein
MPLNHRLHRHGDGPTHIDCICGREIAIDPSWLRAWMEWHCECGRTWRVASVVITSGPRLDPIRAARLEARL